MHWTEFQTAAADVARLHSEPWPALLERIRSAGPFPDKPRCPWIKLARFGATRSAHGSLRNNTNVVAVTGVEGDYDGEQVTPEQAVALLERHQVRASVYTSPSHTPDKPRWRVLAVLSKEYPPVARERFLARINGVLGGILSRESFTLSQSYYFGRVNGRDYQVLATFDDPDEGYCVDELDELDTIAIGKPGAPGDGHRPSADTEREPHADVSPATLRDLRSALASLRADDRDLWVRMGLALKTLGDAGRALWIEWSQTSDKYNPADAARVWTSFKPSGTGHPAVFAEAQRHGWTNPAAKREAKDDVSKLDTRTDSGGGFIPFDDPRGAAWSLIAAQFHVDGLRTLHFWQEEFHRFDGASYVRLHKADVRAILYSRGGLSTGKPIKREHVENVLDALRAAANYSNANTQPSWVTAFEDDPDPRAVILLRNGVLDPIERELRPPTPRLFAANALPFDYQADAPPPAHWLAFLRDLWVDDRESVELLQEWMGYCLTARTEQQKALLLVGPKRGGKGTIGRVLTRLLGAHNVVSPTLASLGTQFGLQPLIGKQVALISDARLGSKADAALMAENVLRVTGEDQISIPRKFMEDFTCTLTTRLTLLTNELPRFTDASGALPSRFLVLQTTQSWFGREDHDLGRRLESELPSILNWCLDGLARLTTRGRFVQPASALQAIAEMEALASPVGAFVLDACNVGPQYEEPVKAVYDAWRQWCEEGGRQHPGTEQTFGRDLKAAVPGLVVRRPRADGDRVRVYQGIGLK